MTISYVLRHVFLYFFINSVLLEHRWFSIFLKIKTSCVAHLFMFPEFRVYVSQTISHSVIEEFNVHLHVNSKIKTSKTNWSHCSFNALACKPFNTNESFDKFIMFVDVHASSLQIGFINCNSCIVLGINFDTISFELYITSDWVSKKKKKITEKCNGSHGSVFFCCGRTVSYFCIFF